LALTHVDSLVGTFLFLDSMHLLAFGYSLTLLYMLWCPWFTYLSCVYFFYLSFVQYIWVSISGFGSAASFYFGFHRLVSSLGLTLCLGQA